MRLMCGSKRRSSAGQHRRKQKQLPRRKLSASGGRRLWRRFKHAR